MLEAPTEGNAYGVVHVHDDRIDIDGRGTMLRSHRLLFQ